jgi:hypothetical protein
MKYHNEEITFDYATAVSEWVGMPPLPCNCTAPGCRKIILDNDWRSEELQRKYNGYFSLYLQKKIDALKVLK